MCIEEQITARSEIQFHQVEGLAVGPDIRFSDLKGTLINFARRLYGEGRPVRFRASHFPFTEPSAEVDVQCFLCDGQGCRLCKYTGWLEICGCGMVHPTVLRNGGYDPDQVSGFAFGMGPERITMLRHTSKISLLLGNDCGFWSSLPCFCLACSVMLTKPPKTQHARRYHLITDLTTNSIYLRRYHESTYQLVERICRH
jgi:phenylalanyl-tRNA synthetase alpha subunit